VKTSIKLTPSRSITVEPMKLGRGILLEVPNLPDGATTWNLQPDQAEVLIFALEQALNAIDLSHRKELENIRAQGYADKYSAKDIGTRCHGDACAAGQLPCPTRAACGVTA
jgi:hypothetical protein